MQLHLWEQQSKSGIGLGSFPTGGNVFLLHFFVILPNPQNASPSWVYPISVLILSGFSAEISLFILVVCENLFFHDKQSGR